MKAWFLIVTLLLPATEQKQEQQQEALRQALQETRSELQAERQRIAAEERAEAEELRQLVAQQNDLSDRLVDLELSVAERSAEVKALRERRAALRGGVESAERDLEETQRILAGACVRLKDLLEVLPPAEGRARQTQSSVESVTAFVDLLSSLLEEGRTASLFKKTVRTPRGTEEEAAILRIGQIAWAYRISSSGAVALAMKAPGAAEGFRWKENLPRGLRAEVENAIEAAAAGRAVDVPFPLDVTQQMATESHTRRETITDTFHAGGPVMIPLGAVALLALLLILERLLFLAREGRGARASAGAILALAESGGFEEAQSACASHRGPVPRALGACLKRRKQGLQAMEDAVQEAILHELPRLERFLSTIGILAGVAPLLGLLGTVTGMIITFDMIATFGVGDPRLMAGGISQALITTATGLAIAIPILLTHSLLAAKVDRLIADTERFAATLLNLLGGGGR